MKYRLRLLCVLLFTTLSHIYAQEAKIYGLAKSYANKYIKAVYTEDYITYKQRVLQTVYIDTSGKFEFRLNVADTELIQFDLITQGAYLYVAPGQDYLVLLPMYKNLTIEQILSPYFSPEYYPLPVLNEDTNNLNFLTTKLNFYYNTIIESINKPTIPRAYVDSLISTYPPFEIPHWKYIEEYVLYKRIKLKFVLYPQQREKLINELVRMPISWRNPTYFSAFNSLFKNILDPSEGIIEPYTYFKALKSHNFINITDSLKVKFNTSEDVSSLIALRGLYDLFYSRPNLQDDIIATIYNAKNILSDSNLNLIATNIYSLITQMRLGYPPPDFRLPNRLGIKKSLRSFKGKFVYLNFCYPQLLGCQQQLPILERYYASAPNDFEIVTIVYGMNQQEFRNFLKLHRNYKWVFLNGEADYSLLQKYKVEAFPTYYLIDPDGNLIANPAPSPIENFEQVFSGLYKKWHRNKTSSARSITTE